MNPKSSLNSSGIFITGDLNLPHLLLIQNRLVGEVSIGISRTAFKVKTFHSDRGNRSMSLHDSSMASMLSSSSGKSQMTTEMCLDPRNEFDQFEYRGRDNSQEIILCCKEVKSLLWLSEASEIPSLNMYFTQGGRSYFPLFLLLIWFVGRSN